jgi:GPH family glycoside/pentoside/hexuronide:cation symporter
MPDICDIDELQSGERREALFASVITFCNKLARAGVFILGGFLVVKVCGFNKDLGADQPLQVFHTMLWIGFPAWILCTILNLILTIYIPITPEYMATVRAELDRRRHGGQTQEGIAE